MADASDGAGATAGRVWRVTTLLQVPKSSPMAPGGGLPEQLVFESRMPEQARRYDDIAVAVRVISDEAVLASYAEMYGANPQLELLNLVADVPGGPDPMSALEKFAPVFEAVLDLMIFDMATPMGVGAMHVMDVTPPIAVGEQRESQTYSGSPFDRNARSVEMQAIQGRLLGALPERIDLGDSKTAAVLRWFVKSLNTNLLHDQFIFLWIALEILCDMSDTKVEQPYTCPRGHEIPKCPECSTPTTRLVRGATLRAYLESFGVQPDTASDLWRMRQLMHGAIPFDSEKLANLGALVQPLRAVVAAGLKDQLGKNPADPPIVASEGLSIHPVMALGGTGEVAESDTRPLIEDGSH